MKIACSHCDNCGAPLEIPARAHRVTCLYCESSLEVLRTDSVVTTAVIDELRKRVTFSENEIRSIKLREQLNASDHQWKLILRQYGVREEIGRLHTRSEATSVLIFGVTVSLISSGCLWWTWFIGIHRPTIALPLGLLGVPFGALAIHTGLTCRSRVAEFERARARHIKKRRALLKELEEYSSSAGTPTRGTSTGSTGPAEGTP